MIQLRSSTQTGGLGLPFSRAFQKTLVRLEFRAHFLPPLTPSCGSDTSSQRLGKNLGKRVEQTGYKHISSMTHMSHFLLWVTVFSSPL